VDRLLETLSSQRRRIRIARAVETAAKGAFYSSLAVGALLAGTRVAGIEIPGALAWVAIAAVAAFAALRSAGRPFTRTDCAIHLDRLLGLEERLSTAVESSGSMREAQAADAAAALARTALPPWRAPREAKLLAGSVLLVGAILVLHRPASAGGTDDPALIAVTEEVARQLDAVAPDRVEFREVRELLRDKARLSEAGAKLQALRDLLDQKLLQEGGGSAEARKQRDAAAAGAAALSAELARMGMPLRATPPAVAALKLERQMLGTPPPPELARDEASARRVATVLERADWPAKYDSVIRKYYGSEAR